MLDESDDSHSSAAATFESLHDQDLTTHNHVVLESVALVHRRLGVGAVRALTDRLLDPIEVAWVDRGLHEAALTALLAADRGISLVDQVSFDLVAGG